MLCWLEAVWAIPETPADMETPNWFFQYHFGTLDLHYAAETIRLAHSSADPIDFRLWELSLCHEHFLISVMDLG